MILCNVQDNLVIVYASTKQQKITHVPLMFVTMSGSRDEPATMCSNEPLWSTFGAVPVVVVAAVAAVDAFRWMLLLLLPLRGLPDLPEA